MIEERGLRVRERREMRVVRFRGTGREVGVSSYSDVACRAIK